MGEDPAHLPGGCQPHPARSSGPSQGSQPPEEHGLGETLGALPCTSLPACLPGELHNHGRCDGQQPTEGQPRPASRRKATLHSTVTARCASRSLEKPPSQCMALTSSDSEPQVKSPLPGIPQHRGHSRPSMQSGELGAAPRAPRLQQETTRRDLRDPIPRRRLTWRPEQAEGDSGSQHTHTCTAETADALLAAQGNASAAALCTSRHADCRVHHYRGADSANQPRRELKGQASKSETKPQQQQQTMSSFQPKQEDYKTCKKTQECGEK